MEPTWALVSQLAHPEFGIQSDVTFQFVDDNGFEVIDVDHIIDEEVKAHKMILALVSQKFKDIFYTTPPSSDVFVIKNVAKDVFAAMIAFIYGNREDLENLSMTELLELVILAEEYEVVGLVKTTMELIENFSVTEENLLETVKEVLEFENISDVMFHHCAAYIKANLNLSEIEEFITCLDQEKMVAEKLRCAMSLLIPPPCSNCLSSPCLDKTTIPHTERLVAGCQVAVQNNNCPDKWGSSPLGQHGEVTKMTSLQMVQVAWCDGSESEYNVHHTDNKNDPQLVYHCGAVGA